MRDPGLVRQALGHLEAVLRQADRFVPPAERLRITDAFAFWAVWSRRMARPPAPGAVTGEDLAEAVLLLVRPDGSLDWRPGGSLSDLRLMALSLLNQPQPEASR